MINFVIFFSFLGLVSLLIHKMNHQPLTEAEIDFINKLKTSLTNKDYSLSVNAFISVRHVEERVHKVETVIMIDGEKISYTSGIFFNLTQRQFITERQSQAAVDLVQKHFRKIIKEEGEICPDGYETIYSGL